MGPISREGKTEAELVMLPRSHYSDPLLSWKIPPALTDIEFLNSSKLRMKYTNNIFVGDYNGGNLYFFRVNDQRNDLRLDEFGSALSDLVDNNQEFAPLIIGTVLGALRILRPVLMAFYIYCQLVMWRSTELCRYNLGNRSKIQ